MGDVRPWPSASEAGADANDRVGTTHPAWMRENYGRLADLTMKPTVAATTGTPQGHELNA